MTFSKSQLTQYAHEYLQGYNSVPIGALDSEFFKSEVRRLWGPAPTAEEVEREQKRAQKQLARLVKARDRLLGPRGGRPKSGVALQQFKSLEFAIRSIGG